MNPFDAPAVVFTSHIGGLKTRKAACLIGALGLVTLTAGCVQDRSRPSIRPTAPTAWPTPRLGSKAHGTPPIATMTAVPNRYERDANGDGVPNRYQGRP
jgi:hypothetical protein